MNYYKKYNKYKQKHLFLKNLIGGANVWQYSVDKTDWIDYSPKNSDIIQSHSDSDQRHIQFDIIIVESDILHGINLNTNIILQFINESQDVAPIMFLRKKPEEASATGYSLLANVVKPLVLVMCQRRLGAESQPLHQLVIPNLEGYIQSIYPDPDIKYLTDITNGPYKGSADYDIELKIKHENAREFAKSHFKYFDLIILNTCGFKYMEYGIISYILKNAGRIIFTASNSLRFSVASTDMRLHSDDLLKYFVLNKDGINFSKKLYLEKSYIDSEYERLLEEERVRLLEEERVRLLEEERVRLLEEERVRLLSK